MDVKIFENSDEIAKEAAELIASAVKKDHAVLGLATGASPLKTYALLVEKYNNGEISFKNTVTFNLDEYYGISRNDKNSYYAYMRENLFDKIDILEENAHVPDSDPYDVESYCESYDKAIEDAGGVDIQLLGIGTNGHIGFNEPSNEFTKGTHKVILAENTIESNMKYFPSRSDMPKEAITMGIGTIIKAKEIVLIAEGEKKAEAIKKTIEGEVSPSCPASILQNHPNAHILVDKEAAKLLSANKN